MVGVRDWVRLGAILVLAGMLGCGDDSETNGTSDAAPALDTGPTDPVCGNGIVEEGEDCDNGPGANIDGSGCDSDCTFSCTTDAECDDGNPCNGEERCRLELHVCQEGTPLEDGTECDIEPDADEADGGAPEPVVGKCIQGTCGAPCTDHPECDDGNPCNGEEACDAEHEVCAPGEPLDCDDDNSCTVGRCEPEEGCVQDVIDQDTLDEVPEDAPTWYPDCDGDGYAAAGAEGVPSCSKPATTASCTDWTQRDPTLVQDQDCDDLMPLANPGVASTEWFDTPYCVGAGVVAPGSYPNWNCPGASTPSFDYDCNGVEDRSIASTETSVSSCDVVCIRCGATTTSDDITTDDVTISCTNCEQYGCSAPGWTASTVPDCGETATWRDCSCDCPIGVICVSCDECVTGTRSRLLECR